MTKDELYQIYLAADKEYSEAVHKWNQAKAVYDEAVKVAEAAEKNRDRAFEDYKFRRKK